MPEHSDDVMHATAAAALSQWDLPDASLELMSRAENIVYRVTSEAGRHALRIHRPGYHTLAELQSEQAWTAALHDAGIGVPVALLTRAGEGYATVPVPGTDETRQVGLVEWLDGDSMGARIASQTDPRDRAVHFRQMGQLMARIHDATQAWAPPASFTRHALDANGLMGAAPFWGPFWVLPDLSAEQRELVLAARATLHARLAALPRDAAHYGMIHADLHPANVLVDADALHAIDFDDAGFSWHAYELAVGLFHYAGSPDYGTFRDALVAGYRAVRPLSDETVELLPMLHLVRGLSLLGWYNERPEVERGDRLVRLVKWVTRVATKYV